MELLKELEYKVTFLIETARNLQEENIKLVQGPFHSSVPSQSECGPKWSGLLTTSSAASVLPSIASGSICLTNPSLPKSILKACMILCSVNFQ